MVFRFSLDQGLVRPPARKWAKRRNWCLGFFRNDGKLTIKLSHKITKEFGFQIGLSAKILIRPRFLRCCQGYLPVWRSPERDSNTRPIDYKSIALDQLSYRGARFDYFVSSLKGFALRLPRSYAGTIFPGFEGGNIWFRDAWNQIRKAAALPLFGSHPLKQYRNGQDRA